MREKNSSEAVPVNPGGPEISESLARIQRVVAPMGNRNIDIQYAADIADVMVEKAYGGVRIVPIGEALIFNQKEWVRHEMGLSRLKREARACVETPFAEAGFDYRHAPEMKEMPEIPANLSTASLKQNYPGRKLSEYIENLATSETQTWLDVALIQAATKVNFMQDRAIAEGMDVAKMFFGEESRIEKILKLYVEQTSFRMIMVLLTMLLAVLVSMCNPIAAFHLLDRVMRGPGGSRRLMSKKYLAMEVPEEAGRFVELAYAAHDLMKKLEKTVDAGKRAKLEEKLGKLLAEAEVLVVKNRRMLGARVKEGIVKEKGAVREEEFGGDENNSEIVVATKVRIAAAGVRVAEGNEVEASGEAEIEAEAAEVQGEKLMEAES